MSESVKQSLFGRTRKAPICSMMTRRRMPLNYKKSNEIDQRRERVLTKLLQAGHIQDINHANEIEIYRWVIKEEDLDTTNQRNLGD